MSTCLTDLVTYELTYTLLDGPYAGRSGAKEIYRSKFITAPRVGDTLQMRETIFGNDGFYRVDGVRKVTK